jgi:hypothetical protein
MRQFDCKRHEYKVKSLYGSYKNSKSVLKISYNGTVNQNIIAGAVQKTKVNCLKLSVFSIWFTI